MLTINERLNSSGKMKSNCEDTIQTFYLRSTYIDLRHRVKRATLAAKLEVIPIHN